jgi:chemotaxis protein methyltransferase CheR
MTAEKENKTAPGRDPALLFLDRRVTEILGINAAPDSLAKLKEYLESVSGSSPADFNTCDKLLSTEEGIAAAARFVTINETYFFREPVHFKLLARRFLPQFKKMSRPIRICSAASSTGCEAYSLAMLMDFYNRGKELFLPYADISSSVRTDPVKYEIDAFDVNPEVIDYARNGRYTENTLRDDGSEWRPIMDIYLKKEGKAYTVAPFLRDKINFFTHNIMDGLDGPYDLIFFRNALIYFSPKARSGALDSLAGALDGGGFLIVGVSETASVDHPRLENAGPPGVFYFRKKAASVVPAGKSAPVTPPAAGKKRKAAPVDIKKIGALVEHRESLSAARGITERLDLDGGTGRITADELIAAAVTFLGAEELVPAGKVISVLEGMSDSAAASFLRAEYCYRNDEAEIAEEKYQEASLKDKAFWPAFYRLSSLAAGGNRTRYEYRIRKALESMEAGQQFCYEIFIGGFSPGYYRHVLERKLAESACPVAERKPPVRRGMSSL